MCGGGHCAVTDLIDKPASNLEPRLYRDRLSVIESGQQTWPMVERRMAPRRREESARPDDRRVTELPTQPNLKLVVPETDGRVDGRRRPHDRHIRRYRTTAVVIDVFAASVGAVVAQVGRFGIAPTDKALVYWWGSLALPALWILAVLLSRAYENRFLASSAEEYRRVINAAVGLIAGIAVVSYLMKTEFARGYVVLALPCCMAISLLGRYTARRRLRRARKQGKYLQDVLVVGHEWAVLDLVAELRRNPDSGLNVVGACVPGGRGSRQMADMEVPVVGDLNQVVESVKRVGADVLAVTTCVEFGGPELRRVCWALENSDVEIVVAPALIEVAGPRLHIRPVAKLPLLHVEKPELTGARRVIKNVFDRSAAAAALLFFSPLLIGVALSIRLTSRGPALFRQTRVGSQGKPFTIYKFRSMYANAEERLNSLQALNERREGLLFKIKNDPRVTPIGRILRRYSIDELPQLINVLKGDMSLVGPRPPLPVEVAQYSDDVRRRLLVRPGVTGLWQVSGRSDLEWVESVRLDLRYVENWSLIYDFEILWKTFYAVLRGAGAY
jgi:exopolysaccharide biosynthesis polyprenyl glycosylphosphotransferase